MSSNQTLSTKFNEICRTCLKGGQLLTYLYDEENSVNLVEKLKSCTALQFDKTDQMPNKICPTCIEELLQAYNFINKCQINDATLKKYLQNEIAKIEDDVASESIKIEVEDENEDENEKENGMEAIVPDEHFDIVSDISFKDEFFDLNQLEETSSAKRKREMEQPDAVFDCSVDLSSSKKFASDLDNVLINASKLNSTFTVAEREENDVVVRAPARKTRSEMSKENFTKIKRRRSNIPTGYAKKKKKKFGCPVCPSKWGNVPKLLTHFQSHTETKDAEDKEEERRSTIHLTQQITKQNRIYQCQICWRTCNGPEPLLNHYKEHVTTNKCEYCGQIFNAKNLRKHIQEHHAGPDPYRCDLCEKKVADTDALAAHKNQLHSPANAHKCRICFYTFATDDDLKTHENAHFGETSSHNCQTCKRVFADVRDLIAHKSEKRCGRFYACNKCPEVFQLMRIRNVHQTKHE